MLGNPRLCASRGSTRAKCGNAADLLDSHLGETRSETVGERFDVVVEIVEDALLVVEAEQDSRERVRRDAPAEDGGTEERGARLHRRAQMIDDAELLAQAARQAMQHVSETDAVDRLDVEENRGEQIHLAS